MADELQPCFHLFFLVDAVPKSDARWRRGRFFTPLCFIHCLPALSSSLFIIIIISILNKSYFCLLFCWLNFSAQFFFVVVVEMAENGFDVLRKPQ